MPKRFLVFFVTWGVLANVGALLFYFNKNTQFKRKCFPLFVILTGALFVAFGMWLGFPLRELPFIVAAVALITLLNIRGTKFCVACGSTLFNRSLFTKMEFCSKCGAKLDT